MFKVKNYMSFKEESTLDLRATSYVQHPSHCIGINNNISLLKTNAIYGANASGKSNFIAAMFFFEQYILSQFISKNDDNDIEEFKPPTMKLEPFLLSKEKNDASEFEIIFYINNKQIQYGFECTSDKVLNEWYFINDKKVYERNGSEVKFGTTYSKTLSVYKKIPEERLYISVLDYFLDASDKEDIIGDFIAFFSNEYHIFFELYIESSVKGVASFFSNNKKLLNDKLFRDKVAEYLRYADFGIRDIDIHEEIVINKKTGKERKERNIKTVHDVFDEQGKLAGSEYFDLSRESSGTLRFFTFIQRILTMLEQGGVFIVDELSARLHPKLTKLIVDIFQSELNDKAQLIFTTHDISLQNNHQFRRDEIVFIDKNHLGESKLYTLSDLKVREDATFSKDYMQGKYGAIPELNYSNLFGGV